jgi:voltage-gated potassium channel
MPPGRRGHGPADAGGILRIRMSEERLPAGQGPRQPVIARMALGKPITPRRAGRVIAGATMFLTLIGGVAVWLLDRHDVGNFGDSLWWALQTVTTVGYGDVVPENTSGRLVGALLMLNGIALVSVVTAAVTAMLIEQARQRQAADDGVGDALERIEARLAQIEAALSRSEGKPGRD